MITAIMCKVSPHGRHERRLDTIPGSPKPPSAPGLDWSPNGADGWCAIIGYPWSALVDDQCRIKQSRQIKLICIENQLDRISA